MIISANAKKNTITQMIEKATATDYFEELYDTHSEETSIEKRYARSRILLEKVTKSLTLKDLLQFSNFFSMLSFVCKKLQLSKKIHSLGGYRK